ncbi:uncharacterized protein [Arachis hypogaea]|uniref:uncharacterized protein n=1 Tax=Arachis hypogaea TaxID=3818 RepID=UPI003B21C72E
MELLKTNDFKLNYHPGKANVVADALSHKSLYVAWMMCKEEKLLKDFENLNLGIREVAGDMCLNQLHISSDFKVEIQKAQRNDQELQKMLQVIKQRKQGEVTQDGEGVWRYKGRICMYLNLGNLRHDVLTEAHWSKFSIHPGSTKMYHDLKFLIEILVSLQGSGGFSESIRNSIELSTTYHPQTNGQSERTIQTLEDMLRASVLDQPASWDRYMPLVVFAYNNSYHRSIRMALYKALYERKCQSPLCWYKFRELSLLGPELVAKTIKQIKKIRNKMLTAQSLQKSYADQR